MGSKYYESLITTVLNNSQSKVWNSAVLEWEINDCEEDESLDSSCICGKENLRYLFTIKNIYNGRKLYPIGSSCIKKFEREDLKQETTVHESLFKLLRAVDDQEYITLSTEHFSRKLLLALYERGAFDTTYNSFNGEQDYIFMLNMFNKRDKSRITPNQHKKIRAIIVSSIRPFLIKQLEGKVKNSY